MWLSVLNYMSLLYALLGCALAYLVAGFYEAAQMPVDEEKYPDVKNLWSVGWLKPFVLLAPIATCVTVALGWLLTESHIFEIHKRLAVPKHDRAVQIIALPSVFGVMALASLLPIFELTTGRITKTMLANPWYDFGHPFSIIHDSPPSLVQQGRDGAVPADWKDAKVMAYWRYETCNYVADSFEAWALYQFGRLILEQVKESMARQESRSFSEAEKPERLTKVERDLQDSNSAVASLTWVGTSLFVVCCVAQSAASLWPYLGGSRADQASLMDHLGIAGFVTSCAAIYNLVVVEQAFHRHLRPMSPVMKFLTVKILVSLCWLQRCALSGIQYGNSMMPGTMQSITKAVPFIGDILSFSELQVHLFYPALIIYECALLAVMHLLVWKSAESWYTVSDALEYTENDPLLLRDASSTKDSAA